MMAAVLDDTAARVQLVRDRLAAAATAHGRSVDDIRLIGVSKTHDPQACAAAVRAGVDDLGENRVQELVAKAAQVGDEGPTRWHLIGPLQSNKVGQVVNRGWWLHTLDRPGLIDRLARLAQDPAGQAVLVQVNVSNDPAKAGCQVHEAPGLVDHAVAVGLDVRGLMTIPTLPGPGEDPVVAARPHFAALRQLAARLRKDHPTLTELSMGMSADLEAAVAEGATMVRLGTAVFGTRGEGPWIPTNDAART